MYKTNIVFIIFFIILTLSSLFFYISYFNNDSNKMYTSHYSYKGIKLIPQNAPQLSSLFDNINNAYNDFGPVSGGRPRPRQTRRNYWITGSSICLCPGYIKPRCNYLVT